jgi:RTX calcium-binding nonapeptide repeat (4 copies)
VANIFDVQGFGALSEWNGQFSSASADQAFQTIASLGSNSIELTDRIWTETGTSNTVIEDPAKTESDASLLASFQAAHAAGLSVVFRAAISPLDGTATSSMAPTDVSAFFASYEAEIVHLATLAQAGGVATFAIGNEMSSLTGAQYRGDWTNLISAVRAVYHGDLTYSAATDEAAHVSFWDELDTIGVNTYPPLTSSETPTTQDLVNAWTEVPINPYYAAAFDYQSPVDFLHSLSEQYGKPVLMTEVGYRSIDGTAINPGSWDSSGTADPAAQATAYNAFFQVWSAQGGSWLKGVELWQWDLSNAYNATGYSPMGKPAEAIVSQYYHGDGYVPGLTVWGSSIAQNIDIGGGNNVVHAGRGDDVIHVGDGNNTIYGGPSTATPLATTTITLTGYGSAAGGIDAQAEILVNGNPVTGLLDFKSATDPSGYQTYTVTFTNPAAINSVDVELMNATPGRALYVEGLSVNGVALTPSEATNASDPGTFQLYVHSIHFDTTDHQDWFFGASTDNDTIVTGTGNNTIVSGAGNDTIEGGGGTNIVVYAGDITDYSISVSGSELIVSDKVANRDGTDHLTDIAYLEFADTTISTSSLTASSSGLAAGDLMQVQAVDTAGDVTTETVRHADGSTDIYRMDIAGQDYTSEHDVISAGGTTTLIERDYADGDLAFKQVVNSDGSVDSASYDTSGHLIEFATRYTDGSFEQFSFNATGTETGETVRHADGSRDIYSYDIAGQDYTSQHVATDASGHSTLIDQYHSDGTLALQQTVDANGVKTIDQYDSLGHLAEATVIQQDGSYVQSDYAPGGSLTDQTLRHADGSRDIYDYGIVGKDYTSQHVVEDAEGHSTLIEQYRSDGTLVLEQTVNTSGVKTLDQYDGAGDLVEQTVSQKDGSYVQSVYAPDGSLATETTRQIDGTRNVDTYDIAGQAYSARHDLIAASGHTLETTFDNNDGSHTLTAYASGVTLTATTGNDVMNSAGGDTFVFKQALGNDVINNFRAGDAAGHDVLEIASTLAANLADLSTHIVGHDTVIALGHDASIILTGVVTPLTPHDVLIV